MRDQVLVDDFALTSMVLHLCIVAWFTGRYPLDWGERMMSHRVIKNPGKLFFFSRDSMKQLVTSLWFTAM